MAVSYTAIVQCALGRPCGMSAGDCALRSDLLLSATGLGAIRGERRLYSGVDIKAGKGDVILLRGKNGSGKTTLLRQLAGLTECSVGNVSKEVSHHWIGHSNGLKAHETPRSHLRHWSKVWGANADFDHVISAMGLARPADVPARLLSAGQKRRTAIGRLKLVERSVWLLDEPFNALDSDGQSLLAEMIETHRAGGGAVIAALHGDAPVEASGEVAL